MKLDAMLKELEIGAKDLSFENKVVEFEQLRSDLLSSVKCIDEILADPCCIALMSNAHFALFVFVGLLISGMPGIAERYEMPDSDLIH